MSMKDILTRLRRQPARKAPNRDWSTTFTQRDWADLPTYHPRREDDAI